MRMRKKPNLLQRMESVAEVMIKEPEELCGRWRESFPEFESFHLELGCGKGRFTAETAQSMKEAFLIAIERVPDAMVIAMERAVQQGLKNVRFIDRDVLTLREIFAPGEASRIYINFCDPWPKSRDAKHRLTAPGFLRTYGDILPHDGEIHFKTDNSPLFEWSLGIFEEEGWLLREVSRDLHAGGICGIMTDYEAKFHAEGVKINRLVAVRGAATKDGGCGLPPRLKNASLVDARGYEASVEDNK